MRPNQAGFVTACQQLLALGVVLAVLTPAASVLNLDVVHRQPGTGSAPGGRPAAGFAAYEKESRTASRVPTTAVDAELTEYALTAGAGKSATLGALPSARGKVGSLPGDREQVTSLPVPVRGYAGVGLTWDRGATVDDHDARFEVRSLVDGEWTGWLAVPYHDEHGPGGAEARDARPGTDLVLVGKVEQVQVRGAAHGRLPAGLRLAVTAPGKATATQRQQPALDAEDAAAAQPARQSSADGGEEGPAEGEEDGLDLQAAAFTPKPKIFSRKQWGANERLRDKSSLRYYEVHAGFVHHTVNANDYSRSEVPGILRSIYAYHTQSRGWSDVGYNFLVDKFGRIWEGRAGGIGRPVVGAHTLGYNEYSFAMSAIGNFEVKRPRRAMLEAYGSLFAWKLALHGVDASSAKQSVGSATFPAINGHRDAGQTACPGRHLYAKLSTIRELAKGAQRGWSGRQLESDLASTPHPDLLVRRTSDGQAFVVPTGGLTGFHSGQRILDAAVGTDVSVLSPDLTGDDVADLLVRDKSGVTSLRPGTDSGFGKPSRTSRAFVGRDLVTPVGDLDGDGNNDVVARNAKGSLNVYLGRGSGGLDRRLASGDWGGYDLLAAIGDADGDGRADLVARDTEGRLWRFLGTGKGDLGSATRLPGRWGKYDTVTGFGDFNRDGLGDLLVRRPGKPAYVRPARGDGSFGHQVGPIVRLQKGSRISAAQLTGDGAPDVVVRRRHDLVVFANKGTFDTTRPVATGIMAPAATALLNAGDWDRDGHGDVVTRTRKGRLLLFRGTGNARFAEPVRLAKGFADIDLLAAVGDMTGDGWPDLMGQPSGGAMRLYPGKGVDGLRKSYPAHSRISAGAQVPVGRWDGDGAPDSMFRSGDRLTLYRGNGPGGLTGARTLGLDLGRYDWVVGVSDISLSGHPDLLVRARKSGNLFLLPGSAKGFGDRRFLAEGMEDYQLVN